MSVILSDLLVATPPETWTMQWSFENPPTIEASEPASDPGACLTLAKWTQLTGQNDLPAPAVEGRIISTVNEGDPLPAIYISSLDGTISEKAAIGGWPSLSNDGSQLAYSAADGLNVLDLSTGQNTSLGTDGHRIIWSPDDTRLMFTTTFSLYVVNTDGSGLEQIVTESSQVISPVGWLPDNQRVVYSILTGSGFDLKWYHLQSGETESLFTIHNKAGYGAISPDGQWIVFADHVGAAVNWSIFIARLDGSERRLVAEPEVPTAFASVWGPDGSWLIVNTRASDGTRIPVLVNPFVCQATVLQVNGAVEGWSR
jgi:Tol biopolymer transport system component